MLRQVHRAGHQVKASKVTVGTMLATGERVAEIAPSVTQPGSLTFLLARNGTAAAMVVNPTDDIEVV